MKNQQNNKISLTPKPMDIVLGKRYDVGEDHPNYQIAKNVKTVPHEKVRIVNPITKRKATVELSREGTTEKVLGSLLLSPDATREQRDSMIAQYLFEQGRENGSFMAELYVSKGKLTKDTQAFKRQMRFDFENFASMVVLLFQDISKDITDSFIAGREANDILYSISTRFEKGAELILEAREKITTDRLREKGFGVYIDSNGKAYSIHEPEIESVVRKEKESLEE